MRFFVLLSLFALPLLASGAPSAAAANSETKSVDDTGDVEWRPLETSLRLRHDADGRAQLLECGPMGARCQAFGSRFDKAEWSSILEICREQPIDALLWEAMQLAAIGIGMAFLHPEVAAIVLLRRPGGPPARLSEGDMKSAADLIQGDALGSAVGFGGSGLYPIDSEILGRVRLALKSCISQFQSDREAQRYHPGCLTPLLGCPDESL